MDKKAIWSLLESNRFILYQLLFIFLFAFASPILIDDVTAVIRDETQIIYIGVIGLLAIVADSVGTIIKSRELRPLHASANKKLFDRFFVSFWILRVFILMFSGQIIGKAITGNDFDEDNWFLMTMMVVEILRWLVMGFISYYTISEGKDRTLSSRTILIGDISLLFSSLFYLCGIWMSMNFTKTSWADMDMGDKLEYFIPGFLLFLMIYIPSTLFQFLQNLLRSTTRKDKIYFWIGIFMTGMFALIFPLF